MSLGVDPLSTEGKTCNMNCVYCQLGETINFSNERKIFVPTEDILKEIRDLPPLEIDYITFSSRGEPTLAKNLGEIISAIKSERIEDIAVITNSVLMYDQQLRNELLQADFVLAKLDACDQESLAKVNRIVPDVNFDQIVGGIKKFSRCFEGRLALQIMFIDANKYIVERMAKVAKEINPDEIEINTPLRPCGVAPLSKEEIDEIKKAFEGLPFKSVYDAKRKNVKPIDEQGTRKRHGDFSRQNRKD